MSKQAQALKSPRRVGTEQSATRTALLDATEQIMLEEGYAAVSTRRVASKVGLTPALVHYYFPTTDDLLVAACRRSTERQLERIQEALATDNPLEALWRVNTDPRRTALGTEFMAMANHRKVIGTEIGQYLEQARNMQANALPQLLSDTDFDPKVFPPSALLFLISGVSMALVMEESLGVSTGHAEARAMADDLLRRFSKRKGPRRVR